MSTSLSPRLPVAQNHPTRQQLDELDALLQRMLALPVQPSDDAAPEAPPKSLEEPRPPRKEKPPPAPTPSPRVNYTTSSDEPDTVVSEGTRGKADTVHSPRETPAKTGEEVNAPAPEAEPETSADSPTISLGPKAKEQGDGWVPFKSSWEPSSLTWQPLKENWREVQAALRRRAEEQESKAASAVPIPQAARPAPTPPVAKGPAPAKAPEVAAPVEQPKNLPALRDRLTQTSESDSQILPDDTERASRSPVAVFNRLFDLCLVPLGALGRWFSGPVGGVVLGIIGVLSFLAAAAVVILDWIGWTW